MTNPVLKQGRKNGKEIITGYENVNQSVSNTFHYGINF